MASPSPSHTLPKTFSTLMRVNTRKNHLFGVFKKRIFLVVAAIRGFMTVRGIPDCSRASRIVLKDYVNGKLCYCVPPPGVEEQQFNPPTTIQQPTRAGGRHIMIHPPQHGEGELGDQQENVIKF